MGHWDAEQLVSVLEGEFAAAVVGADEAVSRDLAFSLSQDVPVVEDLRRDGGRLLIADAEAPVTVVGHDYLEAGSWLVPLNRAVTAIGHDRRPGESSQIFLGRLRRLAREDARAVVGLVTGQKVAGSILKATPDHVVLAGVRRVAVPVGEVAYLKLVRGGSADAL